MKIPKYYPGLFLTLLGVLFVFQGSRCKPDPPKPHPTIRRSFYLGGVKDYLYFKPGSYWIYKNTVTNEIDTVKQVVMDTSRKRVAMDLPDAYYIMDYTDIYYVQTSSLIKRNLVHNLYPVAAYSSGPYAVQKGFGFGMYTIFIYPFIRQFDTTVTYDIGGRSFGTISKIQSGPYTFDSATQIRCYNSDFHPKSSIMKSQVVFADAFWVKGVGLARINIRSWDPETYETWILTDYKIIQ